MLIEISSPACLPLGLVRTSGAKVCLLGVTLQHPPVNLFAQPGQGLKITGARADKAREHADQFYRHHRLIPGAEIEIELAVPSMMGLGSDAVLGLTVARALAWVHNLPMNQAGPLAAASGIGPEHALEIWAFARGGLLAVEAASADGGSLPPLERRQVISHQENAAWAFVFLFPKVPKNTLDHLESEKLNALRRAAPYLSADSRRTFEEELWPAAEKDDFESFASALTKVQQQNEEALAQAGAPVTLTEAERGVLEVMRDNGASAWGRSLTGLGLYGLVKGAALSVDLRAKLQDHVGLFGGIVMAAVTDNDGARHNTTETSLDYNKAQMRATNLPSET